MKRKITRRTGMKWMAAGTLMGLGTRGSALSVPIRHSDTWDKSYDRTWLGGRFWANPMEDWRVREGGAECLNPGGGRSVHSLTHQITRNGYFVMSVTLTRLEIHDND